MVGQTGDTEATIVACKAADDAVKVMNIVVLNVLTYSNSTLLVDGH